VSWKIEGGHAKLLAGSRVVHDTALGQQIVQLFWRGYDTPMILSAVTARRVREYDVLSSLSRLLVEDLALAPQRRSNIDITSNDAVFFRLILLIRGRWARKGIVQEFQRTAPDVSPASESILLNQVSYYTFHDGWTSCRSHLVDGNNAPGLRGLRYPLV
jgi:hypothetical protein